MRGTSWWPAAMPMPRRTTAHLSSAPAATCVESLGRRLRSLPSTGCGMARGARRRRICSSATWIRSTPSSSRRLEADGVRGRAASRRKGRLGPRARDRHARRRRRVTEIVIIGGTRRGAASTTRSPTCCCSPTAMGPVRAGACGGGATWRGRSAAAGRRPRRRPRRPGHRCSPLGATRPGVTTEGLRYPLRDETLALGRVAGPLERDRGGIRHRSALASGTLLVVESRRRRCDPMTSIAAPPTGWRSVDIVVAAVLGGRLRCRLPGLERALDAGHAGLRRLPPVQGLMYGVWLLPAVLVPLDRPPAGRRAARRDGGRGRARRSSARSGACRRWSTGCMQGAAAELAFALTLYRSWDAADRDPRRRASRERRGAAGPGRSTTPTGAPTSSCLYAAAGRDQHRASLAGIGSWLLVRALAGTGVLSAFPAGREQPEV